MKSKLRLFGNKNQCPGCSDYFNSNWPFDLHRVTREDGKRDCLNEEEMIRYRLKSLLESVYTSPNHDPFIDDELVKKILHKYLEIYPKYTLEN